MDLVQAIVLGVLQGLFEWLPVSSQGQVAVAGLAIFGLPVETALNYAIFLHIGTLISAIVYFRKELKALLRQENNQLLKFMGIAVVATVITAAPLYFFMRQLLTTPFIFLIALGILLLITGAVQWKKKVVKKAGLSGKNALFLGLGQGFAVLPGVSRSGTTTSVLLFEGFEPEQAFRLSFLLSVPSVLIAELGFGLMEPVAFEPNILLAVAVAAVVGYISIGVLLKVARKINFGLFCILFGLFYITIAFL
jgi:undecaprenyl-diphosphatase